MGDVVRRRWCARCGSLQDCRLIDETNLCKCCLCGLLFADDVGGLDE